MNKLFFLFFSLIFSLNTMGSKNVFLDCSSKFNPSDGSRSMYFIKLFLEEKKVYNHSLTLFYEDNPDYKCAWEERKKCEKLGIPKYLGEYMDKYGEVRLDISFNLFTEIDKYKWTKKYPCCGNSWSLYAPNGVRVSSVTRDTLLFSLSQKWPEKSKKECKIIDEKKI